MSFIDSLFGKSGTDNSSGLPWMQLTSTDQIGELSAKSNEIPVIIFKHSTRCGISRMVLRGFEKKFPADAGAAIYFLDLLKYREVSNAIADTFQVQHQSPQLILIKNEKAAEHWSHGDIDAEILRQSL
jgi:bacillithiol system protein YtxJ